MINGAYTFTRVNKTVLVLQNYMFGVTFKVGCVEEYERHRTPQREHTRW
jgi:hypothetical protein